MGKRKSRRKKKRQKERAKKKEPLGVALKRRKRELAERDPVSHSTTVYRRA